MHVATSAPPLATGRGCRADIFQELQQHAIAELVEADASLPGLVESETRGYKNTVYHISLEAAGICVPTDAVVLFLQRYRGFPLNCGVCLQREPCGTKRHLNKKFRTHGTEAHHANAHLPKMSSSPNVGFISGQKLSG